MEAKSNVFAGLKVIELASVLAGPAVGMFFAELGAQVIKIENARGPGDVTRTWKLPIEPAESDSSAYYCCANWNKETHFLDLTNPGHYQQLLAWLGEADIVISNYRESTAKKLRVHATQLFEHNASLIYAQIYAYDASDDRPGFDIVMQAESGFLSMTGIEAESLARLPVALIDLLAAHQLKEGVLVALLQRAKDGRGRFVSVSLYDAALASLANQATNYLMAGHVARPMGTHHPNIAPYGDVFLSFDGHRGVLAVGSDSQFERLAKALDFSAAETDAYDTNTKRLAKRSQLMDRIRTALSKMKPLDIQNLFSNYDVPFGWIRDLDVVLEDTRARRLVLRETIDNRITERMATAIFDLHVEE